MTIKSKALELKEDAITEKIYFIKGEKVLLDRDLALLYGIETKALKRAVRRNPVRFPADFMLQLNRRKYNLLRSQFGTLEGKENTANTSPMLLPNKVSQCCQAF